MLSEEWIGPVIIAAAIAALINVLGWVVTGQREVQRDRRRRRERREDVQTALRAEIQHYVDILSNPDFDLRKSWAEVVGQMDDRVIRNIGLGSMLFGLALLYWVN